jgi:hypothetical protein
MRPSPDLFGLIDATSNAGAGEGVCAAATVVAAAIATMKCLMALLIDHDLTVPLQIEV